MKNVKNPHHLFHLELEATGLWLPGGHTLERLQGVRGIGFRFAWMQILVQPVSKVADLHAKTTTRGVAMTQLCRYRHLLHVREKKKKKRY